MSTRATVTINTPADRDQIARWAQKIEVGTVVTFRKKSRSTEQSAKMWAMLHEVAEQVEWYGQKLDAEDWKDMFTASLRHARVVPGIDKGTYVPLGMRTSTMTIEEMTNLIELIYAFGADPAHPVIFKEPKEQESGSRPEPAEAEDSTVSAASDDAPPLPSSSDALYFEWLLNIAKMLWAATNFNGDMSVLKAQKIAAMASYPKPEDCPALITGKAESVYNQCKQIVDGALEKEDGLALIAGIVGVDQDDIGRAA
jgi:hypothetical protein